MSVAQLVELLVVVQAVAGSNPVAHPSLSSGIRRIRAEPRAPIAHQSIRVKRAFGRRPTASAWELVAVSAALACLALSALVADLEQAAELAAASRLVEGFRRFADDAGMEVVGPPLVRSHPIAQPTVPSAERA